MNISRKIIALVFIAIAVFLNSCEKDEPDIPTADRDQFLGQYDAESTGPGGTRNFTLVITASSSAPDQIWLASFDGDNNARLYATVSGSQLSISSQSVSGETYLGTGSLTDGEVITINFSIDDGQTLENRVLTGTKQ